MKSTIKKYMPKRVRHVLQRVYDCLAWDPWSTRSWSQEGEDMVLRRIFGNKENGFYVDVGAHHPKRFSNTYLFYRRGWSGINVDPMPGSMKLFDKIRPRDLNLEVGVAKKKGTRKYYKFNDPALNGFSEGISTERENEDNEYSVEEVIAVQVLPLSEILDKNLGNQEITFLNVDVEGLDLEVLKSNDWTRFRPKIVLVEVRKISLHELGEDPFTQFMNDCGYEVYAKQVNTVLFKDQSQL